MEPVTGVIVLIMLLVAGKKGVEGAVDVLSKLWASGVADRHRQLKKDHPDWSDEHAMRVARGQTLARAWHFLPQTGRAMRRGWTEERERQKDVKGGHQEWLAQRRAQAAAAKAARRQPPPATTGGSGSGTGGGSGSGSGTRPGPTPTPTGGPRPDPTRPAAPDPTDDHPGPQPAGHPCRRCGGPVPWWGICEVCPRPEEGIPGTCPQCGNTTASYPDPCSQCAARNNRKPDVDNHCPQCGGKLAEMDVVCPNCGCELIDIASPPPPPPAEAPCGRCGTPVPATEAYCGRCDAELYERSAGGPRDNDPAGGNPAAGNGTTGGGPAAGDGGTMSGTGEAGKYHAAQRELESFAADALALKQRADTMAATAGSAGIDADTLGEWAHLGELAQQTSDYAAGEATENLATRHGGIAQAAADSPAEMADSEFYDPASA